MGESPQSGGGGGGELPLLAPLSGLDLNLEMVQEILDRAVQIVITQFPVVRQLAGQVIETVFIPKVMARQLVLLIALELGLLTANQLSALIRWLVLSTFSSRHRLIAQLEWQQRNTAATQDEWMDLAERIDNIQGNDVWRSDPSCALYEQERIQARIDEYVHLMRRRDIFELMFLLRGSIGRNKFGLLHEGLFTRALAGSKVLTETYHNVVCAALDFVCDAPVLPGEDQIPTDARLAFFNETRHAYGRTALLLSGGAALGFYHVGVVKTLMENGLMPRVIGGSSAGSIVCAMIGTRTDEECFKDMFEKKGTDAPGHSGEMPINFFRPLPKLQNLGDSDSKDTTGTKTAKNGFWKVYSNTAGAFHDAKRTLQGFVPIPMRQFTSFLYDLLTGNTRAQDIFKNDTAHFRNCVRACVGDFTFQEAFDRTGRILNIVVTPNNSSDPPRLLNYLTAPHVMVWSAAVASSSLPGVFEANRLVVKEADGWERYESGGGHFFSDGSMEEDLPMQQLSEMFNINHFIISQANPHAVMFASYNQKLSVWTNPIIGFGAQIVTFVRNQLRSWLLNLVQCIGARRITPLFETQRGIGTQFFTQEYEGRPMDISLIPWLGHHGLIGALMHIIYNPSEAEYREWLRAAERETWKHIPRIKSHIAEEVTLDRCVQRLRRRLLHESWEKARLKAGTATATAAETASMAVNNKDGKLEGRVPSFFTSSSLVNLSGLNVSDQPTQTGLHDYALPNVIPPPQPLNGVPVTTVVADNVAGWGGMGLRGNRSHASLNRTHSEGSGLFYEDDQHQHHSTEQKAGENTVASSNSKNPSTNSLGGKSNDDSIEYIKTASMAKFYYRKTGVTGEHYLQPKRRHSIARINSASALEDAAGADGSALTSSSSTQHSSSLRADNHHHNRRKSKSHDDLNRTMMNFNLLSSSPNDD